MAEMVSPAGNMEIRMLGFSREGNRLVVISQMGVWDTKIYFTAGELFHLLRLMLSWQALGYWIALPFFWLGSLVRHTQKK